MTDITSAPSRRPAPPLPMRRVFLTWLPLAISWTFMAIEGPMMNAVVNRLPAPEINMAAWEIVFPISLLIEAPIIMLLSASNTLSRDWDSYRKVYRFTMWAGGVLTALHVAVAFTPLYYVVVRQLIGAPEAIIEPARWGLMLMTPWTWSIAYRRFNQGALIHFGHAQAVGWGTAIRLGSNSLVLAIGYLTGQLPGIVVAGAATATGVISEAIYAGLRIRPVLRDQIHPAPPLESPLTARAFFAFYSPLALTTILNMLMRPVGSAALSRMPQAVESLAVWSAVISLTFLLRSLAFAFNEVVLALLDEPRAVPNLRRFAVWLTAGTTALVFLVAATPLSRIWFEDILGFRSDLAALAARGLWVAALTPGLNVIQTWFQSIIVHSRRTESVTWAVAIFLVVDVAVLVAGVVWGQTTGLYVGLAALVAGFIAQDWWLFTHSRPAMRALMARERG